MKPMFLYGWFFLLALVFLAVLYPIVKFGDAAEERRRRAGWREAWDLATNVGRTRLNASTARFEIWNLPQTTWMDAPEWLQVEIRGGLRPTPRPVSHGAAGAPDPGAQTTAEIPSPIREEPLIHMQAGARYQLATGSDFYGIWEGNLEGSPMSTFPGTDEGFSEAWRRYAQLEPSSRRVDA
jgi:hypothetical protein